jgi:hypothetical protein
MKGRQDRDQGRLFHEFNLDTLSGGHAGGGLFCLTAERPRVLGTRW